MGLWTISQGGFKQKEGCQKFFSSLIGQNGLGLSMGTLMDEASQAALQTYNQAAVYDGPSSSTPLDPDKFGNAGANGATTVGQWFAQDRREGLSQQNGAAIFLALDNWNGLFMSSYANSGNVTQYGLGTLLHELLHKGIAGGGFSHDQMINALKAAGQNPVNFSGQNGISRSIGNLCFSFLPAVVFRFPNTSAGHSLSSECVAG